MSITSKQVRELDLLTGKGNKYHARKTIYNGVTYDSKAEAARAAELDAMKACGEVAWWLRQHTFHLAGVTYRADFIVAKAWRGLDVYAEEVKGVEGERFRVIKKLWQQFGPFDLHILKRTKSGWEREIITPKVAQEAA